MYLVMLNFTDCFTACTQEDTLRYDLQCQWFGVNHHCHFPLYSLFPNHLRYFE